MGEWQRIETAPENTWVLVWCPWMGESEQILLDKYRWVNRETNEVESESRNARGRRVILQYTSKRERSWEHGAHPEWWMPLPVPPPDAG
jgi:hypothetical protein